MIIENATAFVELEISIPTGPAQPRRAGIGAGCGDFRAALPEVWIEAGEFEGFLQDLRDLERNRQGKATLAAEDPRQFQLDLMSTDRAGHLEVRCRLAGRPTDAEAALEIRFPLEPSALPAVLRNFERMDAAA